MKGVVTAYLFVFLYLVAMLQPIAPFIEYAVNYDYISEVLCINQDKPELNCNGYCYVSEKVIEMQQQSEENDTLKISIEKYPIGFVEILQLSTIKSFTTKVKQTPFYQLNYTFQLHKVEEHPPEFLV